jgi:hypothetical protein
MMTTLLIAGFAVLAVGLLAIALGIPVKEFSFGNTLILAGAVAACTGVVLLGLSVVVRELQNIARRLGPANAPARAELESRRAADRPAFPAQDGAKPPPSATASRQEDATARPPREDVSLPPPEPAAPPKPRRNLLFSSSRKDRERAGERPAQAPSESPQPASPNPPVQPPAPAATFDDAWPQSERGRSDALRRGRPSTSAEPVAATAAPESAAPADEPAPVTVLKSGVVDGMAYSLYSDGSIEAQMPEGMMRFASIDELRSHLDLRP